MDKMKVQILMSTYNGERFLREQIESLLRQSWKNVEILIRDDGSKDGTREILNEYSDKYENIQVYLESNLGVAGSFFELLKKVTLIMLRFAIRMISGWRKNRSSGCKIGAGKRSCSVLQ